MPRRPPPRYRRPPAGAGEPTASRTPGPPEQPSGPRQHRPQRRGRPDGASRSLTAPAAVPATVRRVQASAQSSGPRPPHQDRTEHRWHGLAAAATTSRAEQRPHRHDRSFRVSAPRLTGVGRGEAPVTLLVGGDRRPSPPRRRRPQSHLLPGRHVGLWHRLLTRPHRPLEETIWSCRRRPRRPPRALVPSPPAAGVDRPSRSARAVSHTSRAARARSAGNRPARSVPCVGRVPGIRRRPPGTGHPRFTGRAYISSGGPTSRSARPAAPPLIGRERLLRLCVTTGARPAARSNPATSVRTPTPQTSSGRRTAREPLAPVGGQRRASASAPRAAGQLVSGSTRAPARPSSSTPGPAPARRQRPVVRHRQVLEQRPS